MIPKIIHYCWFGGNPLPPLALECIASWRKYLPEYEIWQWSERPLYENETAYAYENENLKPDRVVSFDVNSIPYTAEAYRQKKYAFVSDYCRFVAMYEYGGIYFDTDVEVIRPMDEIISKGNFMGFEVDPDGENTPGRYAPRYCFDVALGLGFGMTAKHPFMKKMVDYYRDLKFELPPADISWYKTIVAYTTEVLCSRGLKNVQGVQVVRFDEDESRLDNLNGLNNLNITIYPHEYFAPIDVITGRLKITDKTYTIHRYMGSWNNGNKNWKDIVRKFIPSWAFYLINRIKRSNYKIK